MKYILLLFFGIVIFSTIPVRAQAETEKGIELYQTADFDNAIAILEKAVKLNDKDRKAWTYLGAGFLKKGKHEEAAKFFKKAASISVPKENFKEFNDGLTITSKPRASYTDDARRTLTQGNVKLAVEFGYDGKIKSAVVFQGLPHGLSENCLEAVKKIKFDPAQKDGKPVSVIAIIEYNFTVY